jgi:hypothetical protein
LKLIDADECMMYTPPKDEVKPQKWVGDMPPDTESDPPFYFWIDDIQMITVPQSKDGNGMLIIRLKS